VQTSVGMKDTLMNCLEMTFKVNVFIENIVTFENKWNRAHALYQIQTFMSYVDMNISHLINNSFLVNY